MYHMKQSNYISTMSSDNYKIRVCLSLWPTDTATVINHFTCEQKNIFHFKTIKVSNVANIDLYLLH